MLHAPSRTVGAQHQVEPRPWRDLCVCIGLHSTGSRIGVSAWGCTGSTACGTVCTPWRPATQATAAWLTMKLCTRTRITAPFW